METPQVTNHMAPIKLNPDCIEKATVDHIVSDKSCLENALGTSLAHLISKF